eukprot:273315-Rhodomonas_salina.2
MLESLEETGWETFVFVKTNDWLSTTCGLVEPPDLLYSEVMSLEPSSEEAGPLHYPPVPCAGEPAQERCGQAQIAM